jgi:hypothetical protein
MLHEVLLALLGHTGNIILDKGTTFALSDDIHLLHPSEKIQINRIVSLGAFYKFLNNYTISKTNIRPIGTVGEIEISICLQASTLKQKVQMGYMFEPFVSE